MTYRRSTFFSATQLAANRTILRALKLLTDYSPSNSAFSKDALFALDAELSEVEQREFELETMLAAVRATRNDLSSRLHEAVLGAKAAVLSQYGPDSDALASLGLKKKSDYRRPASRRAKMEE